MVDRAKKGPMELRFKLPEPRAAAGKSRHDDRTDRRTCLDVEGRAMLATWRYCRGMQGREEATSALQLDSISQALASGKSKGDSIA
eukprot:CAMPEP_0206606230 /NCGR_PEP_ID=MMETSP0325_2-20121206/51123_1 /ASSEMBLY_ACC=CAM_ASM_000347 /TAXON_ID=2866 /ORGANISM="Crypthecodinium cohnii, Strain Seligo" /LENGTH=85 /DNA_ID=CAMNT_0054122397 /DNA_START=205 /DNA_END=459 /DNA_ORIENTATION=+